MTACSPGVNGIAGLGFDADGHLIGAVEVCRSDFATATLARGVDVASWTRSAGGHGAETWRLTPDTDGRWHRDPIVTPTAPSAPTHELELRVDSTDNGWFSSVHVSLRQLAALTPGHLLVEVDGPPDPSGYPTTVTEVIALDAFGARGCAR